MIPVLLYHSVTEVPPGQRSWGAVSAAAFAEQVEAVVRSGREPITVTALADGLRGMHELPARPVAVTFDDGYSDTPVAVDVLRRHGVAATVYITTGRIGEGGAMGADQLAAIAALEGVEIGSHGVRHRHLDELDERELTVELAASRQCLRQLLGIDASSFAYPHGAYDTSVRAAVIAAGYGSAVAVKNALSHRDDDPFAIARFTVTGDTTPERLVHVLEGAGIPRAWRHERLRTRAYRVARRQRRRLLGPKEMPC